MSIEDSSVISHNSNIVDRLRLPSVGKICMIVVIYGCVYCVISSEVFILNANS